MMNKEESYHKVAIHGVPRSGTTWLGEIINSSPKTAYRYQPLFSYAHKDFLTNASTKTEINEFFIRLLQCEDDFVQRQLFLPVNDNYNSLQPFPNNPLSATLHVQR
jgi:hypothetical protein